MSRVLVVCKIMNALQFYGAAAGLEQRQMETVFLEGGVSGASNKPFLQLSVSI